jgi:4-hydroxy-tetrahydrodipicolinate synthase
VVLGKRFAVFGTISEANSLLMEARAALLDEPVAASFDPARMVPGTGCCSIMGNGQAHHYHGGGP